MSDRRRSLAADQGGATAVEFAILSPVFFALLFGLLNLGWALHCGSSVRWALESSARMLVTKPDATASELRNAMLAKLGDVSGANSVAITLVTDRSNPDAPVARATSAYAYPLSVPFLPTYNLQFSAATSVPVPAA